MYRSILIVLGLTSLNTWKAMLNHDMVVPLLCDEASYMLRNRTTEIAYWSLISDSPSYYQSYVCVLGPLDYVVPVNSQELKRLK